MDKKIKIQAESERFRKLHNWVSFQNAKICNDIVNRLAVDVMIPIKISLKIFA